MDNKKKKILHVTGAMNTGGTETLLMNIFKNVDSKQVQFDFVSYSEEEAFYDKEIQKLGGTVFHLKKTNSIKELYDLLKHEGPYDAVHAHTLFHCGIAVIAACLARVKIRVSHAHTTADCDTGILRRSYTLLMRLIICLFSTHLLACSRAAGFYLFGKRGIRKTTFAYFPNVIDYQTMMEDVPLAKTRKFNIEAGLGTSVVIGHIGRFIAAKNQLFLLEVMKCLIQRDPSIKLLFVGDGELKEQVKQKVNEEKLTDHVRFLGLRRDISTVLQRLDVFVFPSIYEGLGLVLLEAQACGVPCVTSEAIQPEADIGLGLVKQLSLKEEPAVWAETILESVSKKEKKRQKIVNHFENAGYSLTGGINSLMRLYQIGAGDADEKRINHLL
ncbi:glycosyltransferase family 1 protein [Virgibacillus sp. W0181]|uniref:glycosyltransferase family 1 protein n=1 Tax=Virgibacillus sp. W0181 TaxID=3391581 RepID=UPI003F4708F7